MNAVNDVSVNVMPGKRLMSYGDKASRAGTGDGRFLDSYRSLDVGGLTRVLEEHIAAPADLVRSFRELHDAIDRNGPAINSVSQIREVFPEDDDGDWHGLLGGIPVLIKDCIDTTDGLLSTCGSLALKDVRSTTRPRSSTSCSGPELASSARPICPNGGTSGRTMA